MTDDRTKDRGQARKGRKRSEGSGMEAPSGPERLPKAVDASDPETAVLLELAKELVEIRLPQAALSDRGRLEGEDAQALTGKFCGLPGPIQALVVEQMLARDVKKAVALLDGVLDRGWDLPEEVLDPMGRQPGEDVARFLCRWHRASKSKAFQKKLRGVLHKRKARGLEVIEPERTDATEAVWKPPPAVAPQGFLSFPDGSGSRLVWVIRHLALRRTLAVGAMIQDTAGLKEVSIQDLSRKESELYRRMILEDPHFLVAETDPAYCAFRIDEAFRKKEPADPRQKEAYLGIRPLLTELAGGAAPEHPASGIGFMEGEGEERLDAEDPLGRGVELPSGGLLDDWFLDREGILPLADRYEEIQQSRIIVHPFQLQERISGFFREAVREYFSDRACRLRWKTRLEDAAWVLHGKGREAEARKLYLAARNLSDPGGDPSKSLLLLHLARKSLDAVLAEKKTSAERQPSLIVKPGFGAR